MARFACAVLLTILIGCGGNNNVDEREVYWTDELARFFETERNLSDLHPWLRMHDVYYTFDDSDIVDEVWRVQLEWILLDELVCESWFFFLDVTVDKSNQIKEYSLEQQGICL